MYDVIIRILQNKINEERNKYDLQILYEGFQHIPFFQYLKKHQNTKLIDIALKNIKILKLDRYQYLNVNETKNKFFIVLRGKK